MNILSLDTTLNRCSVAVLAADKILAHNALDLRRGHAEALMPMISETLIVASMGFSDLNLIAVTTGPGTFTGQRVGLSAARGIGVARNLPVQGVGSLSAIALGARQDMSVADRQNVDILVVLDARRGEFYLQLFPANTPIWPDFSAPLAANIETIKKYLPDRPCQIVGTGVDLARDTLGPDIPEIYFNEVRSEPDAVEVGLLAGKMVSTNGLPSSPPPPLYLRAPDAKLPGGKSL